MSLKPCLRLLRQYWNKANGEAEYHRYLLHWQEMHPCSSEQPLTRKQFFAALTERKWNGIKRCC